MDRARGEEGRVENRHLSFDVDLRNGMISTHWKRKPADERRLKFFGLQLDRGNLSNALADNLLNDLHLTSDDYNNVSSAHFWRIRDWLAYRVLPSSFSASWPRSSQSNFLPSDTVSNTSSLPWWCCGELFHGLKLGWQTVPRFILPEHLLEHAKAASFLVRYCLQHIFTRPKSLLFVSLASGRLSTLQELSQLC